MSRPESAMRFDGAPTNRAPASQQDRGADSEPSLGLKPRVLVVDDVFDNRDILTRRLSRRGFDVTEAAGGYDALEKIASQSFDVVLLDIMMPDLNGNEVLQRVRETKSATELPVIMVTAKSQSENVVESLELGANDYVTKPVDFAVALARINQQVARKQAADRERAGRLAAEKRAADLTLIVKGLTQARSQDEESLDQEIERRQTEEHLRFLAYRDALTGLLNRTSFRELLIAALQDPEKLSSQPVLLFLDLDRFKAVNDAYGHEVGDRLLQEASSRLRAAVGEGASLARLGGDEFGVLLFERSSEPTSTKAERLVRSLSEPFHINGQQVRTGISCGIARAADCGNDPDDLTKAADLAMYRAKCIGGDGYAIFEPRMLHEQRERTEMQVELAQAIHDGTLDLMYQPMLDSKTRQVTAFEALARWTHPIRGIVPPDTFIPLAEDTGLIFGLGAWVLRRACTEAAKWPSHIRIAVNLSVLQFRSPELVSTIVDCLTSSGLDPSRLELEITESALLEARGQNILILRTIKNLGVRISMDDFGTGYSSLLYLQNFEFDKIKLDRQLVRRAQSGASDGAVVKAIVELANSFGMETTAEGIETSEELAMMTSLGCTELQGYLLGRPLSPADARVFLDRNAGIQ